MCYNTSVIKVKAKAEKGIDTMKKITKKEMFAQIMSHLTDESEINFIKHEIELLENKASQTRKPTQNQIENTVFKSEIIEFLNKGGKFSITDLQNAIDSLKELSNQRVSAILKQLVDSGEVVKTFEKRKAFFSRVGD